MLFRVLSGIMDYGHGVPSLLSLTLLDFDLDYLSHEVRFTTIMVRKKCQKKRKLPRIWLEPPVYIILSPFISSHDHLVMSILMFCAIYAYFLQQAIQ